MSVKLGNLFFSWETTLIQLVHCSGSGTREKGGMSRSQGHLGVQLDPGGGVAKGEMQKAARAEGGRAILGDVQGTPSHLPRESQT